ncbi:MAG: peptidase U32 family protein [Bacillota bacterium]
MKRPELLIPAGNLEKLRTAVLYGADAVYVGIAGLSLRAGEAEFGIADLTVGIREAHQKKVKVYAAVNIFAKNQDLDLFQESIAELADLEIDGLILSDPGLLRLVKRNQPDLPVHLSTQANTTNVEAVKFWKEEGVSRIVLARELSLAEIAVITKAVPGMEIELFIHGAMCVAYSGRCFLSALRTGRSSNHGECTQPCRWEYRLIEATRPNQPLILEEDQRYSYLLSSKDLCMIEYLPEIAAAGVAALKVEGRMKSALYVAVVTRTYRWAIEELMRNPSGYRARPEWLAELGKISNRGYTTGFYRVANEKISEIEPEVKYYQTHDLAGTVLNYDAALQRIVVGVRNRLSSGDEVELLLPDDTLRLNTVEMTDEHGLPVQTAYNGFKVCFPVELPAPAGAVIRRRLDQKIFKDINK